VSKWKKDKEGELVRYRCPSCGRQAVRYRRMPDNWTCDRCGWVGREPVAERVPVLWKKDAEGRSNDGN